MTRKSWTPDLFDRLYAQDPDPRRFETSQYEQAKYHDTLAQLAGRRFASALELGCSIGVMSRRLGGICDRLLGLDAAGVALDRARLRCAGLDHVRFQRAILPQDWPEGRFDLLLVSELLYFLAPADIVRLAGRCIGAAAPDCTILLVNWTGPADTPTTGDEAAELFRAACGVARAGFIPDASRHRDGYRVDRLRRRESRP